MELRLHTYDSKMQHDGDVQASWFLPLDAANATG